MFVKNFVLDDRAQSGTVFRLMVDAIIGLVILMIILSVLGYFESLRVDVSRAEFISTIKSATEAPDGRVVSSGILIFVKGTGFSASQLQSITNYPAESFEFQSNVGFAEVLGNGKIVQMKQNIETRVYARCVPDSDPNLRIRCVISFGRRLEEI